MQNTITFTGNVQHLITVNYQRMVAFEQAAFFSNDKRLRSFYEARADESENYLKELCAVLNVNDNFPVQLCENIYKHITAKKSAVSILGLIISLEKTVMTWYKKAISEVKYFPEDVIDIINRQYSAVGAAQCALQCL